MTMTQLGTTLYQEYIGAARTSELLMTMTQLGVTLYLENIGGQNLEASDDHDPAGCNPLPEIQYIGGQDLRALDDHDPAGRNPFT
jgi:hypothetical protein